MISHHVGFKDQTLFATVRLAGLPGGRDGRAILEPLSYLHTWGVYGVVVFDQLTRVLGQLSEIREPWRVLSNDTTGITLFY